MKFNYKKPYPKDNNFWWIEFGGNLNTIFDANDIQYELKRIAYGVWEYMKNNPDGRCKNYDLDWIGSLPGKRESTRYIGPHILTQNDVMSGGHFPDVSPTEDGHWTTTIRTLSTEKEYSRSSTRLRNVSVSRSTASIRSTCRT